jgi:type VI protein secretion system component Hcp
MAIERWFLKIDGVVGGSDDTAHQGEIDVESWSWGFDERLLALQRFG